MYIFADMRKLYIIAGPNGAGKTTASYTVLPELLECREFVNADEIARGLSPFNPESVAIQAGRLQLERIDFLLSQGVSFSVETTLASKSYVGLVNKAKTLGYETTLLFFWLSSPEMAIDRVKHRVSEGGHNIPEDVIRRRYKAGLTNLFRLFIPIVDDWYLFDNRVTPIVIAQKDKIVNNDLYNLIYEYTDK